MSDLSQLLPKIPETNLTIIYYCIFDTRMGNKNEHQDERIIYRYIPAPCDDLRDTEGFDEAKSIMDKQFENMVINNVHVTENKSPLDRRKSGERHEESISGQGVL